MSGEGSKVNWLKKVQQLKARVGADWMHSEVSAYLSDLSERRLLVACSGGADSVYLLALLSAWSEAYAFELVVAHYNHRWRGLDSDADAAFVEQMAEKLGLQVMHGQRPPKEAAFTETTARALRLSFLREEAQKSGCPVICLGHQQDDILETQLIRLSRGAGADGLAAPRPVSQFEQWPTHVRPLLETAASTIREDLRSVAIPWREDSSNADTQIARNALRQRIIPELSEVLSHDIQLGSARSRRLLAEDADALDAFARERFPRAFSLSEHLDRHRLRATPKAIIRRVIIAWLSDHELLQSVSAHAMDILLDAICDRRETNRFSVGAHYLLLSPDQLSIEWADIDEHVSLEPTFITPGDAAILSNGAEISSKAVELSDALSERILRGAIDQETEAYLSLQDWESLEIRAWEPGDRFKPIGAPGTKKVKDWFIDRQIPRKERKQLPIVLSESGEILWIPGFPPADNYKLTPSTKLALRLTYQSRNPL